MTSNRVRACVYTLTALLFILVTPLAQAAETAPTNRTVYGHCTSHNTSYDGERCGEGVASDRLAQSSEYGPFLCGVCSTCLDEGLCSLTDTMIVIGNVGNFILGIIGSLALLVFVIGGILILTSQGNKDKIASGRRFITAAAVGVAIALGSILILRTLISTVTTGSPGSGSSSGITCDDTNTGAVCGELAECYAGECLGLCEITQREALRSDENASYTCMDPASFGASAGSCVPNRCSGGTDNVCCNATLLPSP